MEKPEWYEKKVYPGEGRVRLSCATDSDTGSRL